MTEQLSELVTRVAEYTANLDMDGENWEMASALNGLLTTNNFDNTVRYWVDRAVETQTSAGQLAYGSSSAAGNNTRTSRNAYNDGYFPTYNPAAMAWSVLEFYERTGQERYLNAAGRQYEYLISTVERTEDDGISRREGEVELFTEIYYFVCPWFVRYGLLTDSQEPIDEAVHQATVHAKHLQDPHTGLYRHIWHESPDFYPAGSYWGRGIGWATSGLLDTILELPADHPKRDKLVSILDDCLNGLIDYQDKSGFWRQRIDDKHAPLEASGTLMFAYTMKKGFNERIFDDERYEAAAERAMTACKRIVDEEGAVHRIARPPASSFSALGTTSYGQGWFLLAADCFL